VLPNKGEGAGSSPELLKYQLGMIIKYLMYLGLCYQFLYFLRDHTINSNFTNRSEGCTPSALASFSIVLRVEDLVARSIWVMAVL
jgi:hypothetical protein